MLSKQKIIKEAINYSNKLLEIETQNLDAWIIKAESVFRLSTDTEDKYDIAMEYLARASKINSSDKRIDETKRTINQAYSIWLNNLGLGYLKSAAQTHQRIANSPVNNATDKFNNEMRGRKESFQGYSKAIECFVRASKLDPYNLKALENIQLYQKETQSWIPRTPSVDEKLRTLYFLKAKFEAQKVIASIEKNITENKAKLPQLDGKQGFVNRVFRANLERTIDALEQDLKRKQVLAGYEPPQ